MTRPFSFGGFAYLLNLASVAISLGAQVDFAGLNTSAMQEVAKHKMPAASIAVVRGDRIVYSKVFGTASLETGDQ